MKKMKKTKISEIHLVNKHAASLSCEVSDETELGLILQDELGRAHLQKRFPLEIGTNELMMELPDLPAGQYNAWIEVSGETFIRQFELEAGASDDGLLSKFKAWLNLF